MSRIDEALRRAAGAEVGQLDGRPDHVFASAWALEAAPEPSLAASDSETPPAGTVALFASDASVALRGFSSAWLERLAIGPSRNLVLVEQFRRLAATLHSGQAASGIRTLMVTSAAPGDGKTLTAVNLALVLSESYRRKVLLIDADLRRPSIGNLADVTGTTGLTEALRSPVDQKLALVQLTSRLTLLPAGRPDPDPLGGLTSRRMQRILEEAASRFDWVVLDAPPVGPLADASLLAEMADGTIFVVRAACTQYAYVQKALEALGRERVLGVVLNGAKSSASDHYERYYTEGGRTSRDV